MNDNQNDNQAPRRLGIVLKPKAYDADEPANNAGLKNLGGNSHV